MRLDLDMSSDALNIETNATYNQLNKKRTVFRMQEKAEIWYDVAYRVRNFSQKVVDKITELNRLKQNLPKKIERDYDLIISYFDSILKADRTLYVNFVDQFHMPDKKLFVYAVKSLEKSNFLSSLRNRFLNLENKAIKFCDAHVWDPASCASEMFSAIAVSNSNIFRDGEKLVITAGVGSFSTVVQPEIKINGNVIPLNEIGYAEFKTTIRNQPGAYSIPVVITFNDQNGVKQAIQKNINYTVIKKCRE